MPEPQTLSEREIEILRLIATGKSNKEIAQDLQISANTVKVHVRNIFAKLEVASRTEATTMAMRSGLIDSPKLTPVAADAAGKTAAAAGATSINGDAGGDVPAEPISGPETTPPVMRRAPAAPGSASLIPAQVWLIAGFVVIVTLLTAIAARLFYSGAAAAVETPVAPIAVESTWQERPSLPAARTRSAAATIESQVYLIGGLLDDSATGELLAFDPETGLFTVLSPKPTPVSEIQAAVLGGRIYVPGGLLASGLPASALEIYDPLADAWEAGPDLPAARSAYALTSHEGKLYLFGGWDGDAFSSEVFMYNPDTGLWTEQSPLPLALGYAGASVAGGRIYVVGGFDGDAPSASTFIYNPSLEGSEPWKEGASMPEGLYAMGAIGIADRLHLIGGISDKGRAFSQMDFTPQTGAWRIIDNPLADEWAYVATAAVGSVIFAFGGEMDGSATDRSLSYQVLFIVIIPSLP